MVATLFWALKKSGIIGGLLHTVFDENDADDTNGYVEVSTEGLENRTEPSKLLYRPKWA